MGYVRCVFLMCLTVLFFAYHAVASEPSSIVTGTIYQLEGNYEISTVDYIYFTVNSAGPVTIDMLSVESDGDVDIDHNNDGEIAYIDPYIYLFRDDGSLDADDYIDENDDGPTGDDGSTYSYDSYLSLPLEPGDYILAVGCYDLSLADAIGGTNYSTDYIYGPDWGSGSEFDHGDYQVTFTGDVSVEIPDADGDGIGDNDDNCPNDANADQADFDDDGVGDVCDVIGDLDGSNSVTRADLSILLSHSGQDASDCSACDLNGDGAIDILDVRQLILDNPTLANDRRVSRQARRTSRRSRR